MGTAGHRILARHPTVYLDADAVQGSTTRRGDPLCVSCVDEPVCVGGRVEDGMQGSGEGVQGHCVETEATSEVRWNGALGIGLAECLS